MSIFNQRLNKILNEWTEPAIDHHLDRGVDLESYHEMMGAINSHYQEEITRLRGLIVQYLKHVGHQMGGADRTSQEHQGLLAFQQVGMVLGRLASTLSRSTKSVQAAQRAEMAPLLMKRGIRNIRNATIQTYRGLQQLQQTLTSLKLNPDPAIFQGVKELVGGLDGELRKVHDYFNQQVEPASTGSQWDMPQGLDQDDAQDRHRPLPGNVQEMLQTPESEWIPMLSPTDLHEIVLTHPDHGPQEATAKISNITSYGPDHNNCGEELAMIVEAWGLTKATLMAWIEQCDWPEESLESIREWLATDAPAEYGLT